MTVEHKARIERAAYLPHLKPGYTEVTIQIPGQVDLTRGDLVTVTVNEGEVK